MIGPRIAALAILTLTGAALLAIVSVPSGATFTAPATNPSNKIATGLLAAPTGVSATIQSNGGTVRVVWTGSASTFVSGQRVYRATSVSGPFTQIAQLASPTALYDDVPGTATYYYVVRAYYSGNGANWESVDSSSAVAKPLHHFSFATVATQHSGTAFTVTVTAQAQDNTTVAGFSGTVALSVASGTVSPTTSGAFAAGTRTQSVTITAPYTTSETITATGGTPSASGTSNAFTLNHFHATALALQDGGGTSGRLEKDDRIVLTFSEAASASSVGTCSPTILSGGDLLMNDASPDTLTANGTVLRFGTISLGSGAYILRNDPASDSACAWTAGNTVLTITLNGIGGSDSTQVTATNTATWTPSGALTSALGEAIDTAQRPSVTAQLF